MKLTVKTLKGSHFEIRVQPSDTIMAVKKNIEDVQGKDNYPCGQQLLIHNGKVLKDESTLLENNVSEDGFLVVMLSKSKTASSSGTTSAQQPATAANPTTTPEVIPPSQAPKDVVSASDAAAASLPADDYSQAASNLVAGNNLEQTIQQLMDMGGGSWDKETVTRALRAAYNNPERAVDYLYSGIPETAEVAVPVARGGVNSAAVPTAAPIAPSSGAPNSAPLNLFPQENVAGAGGAGLGSLDFLRNNQQFQALRSMVQANPQILQPMLQELGKQNPQLLRSIQEHDQEFLQLINEPVDGSDGDMFDQAEQEIPHTVSVTPEEQEVIERLEAMGFDRALVIELFWLVIAMRNWLPIICWSMQEITKIKLQNMVAIFFGTQTGLEPFLVLDLKLNSPLANGFQILPLLTKSNMCYLSIRSNGTRPISRPKIICNMNIAAGRSDEPHKFNLENVIDQARKLWDNTPAPVKSFPWNRALDHFVQLILDIVLTVTKYLYVPVLVVTSISELSYCAHERKLYITLLPFLAGVAIAGILKSAALESSPYLKNADVPWHLIVIGLFFTLLKLPGPYYPYWGRIFIPHLANGALFRTLWFAFLWYRRPRKSAETTLPDSVVADPEQNRL